MENSSNKSLMAANPSFESLKKLNQYGVEYWSARDLERLEMRQQTTIEFKALSGAARDAGVQDKMFGVFHDAGYKGLYGGLGVDAIKMRKEIPPKENLMDRMDTTELIANQFRMSQTREKLKRENIKNQRDAMEAHEIVGKKVFCLKN